MFASAHLSSIYSTNVSFQTGLRERLINRVFRTRSLWRLISTKGSAKPFLSIGARLSAWLGENKFTMRRNRRDLISSKFMFTLMFCAFS